MTLAVSTVCETSQQPLPEALSPGMGLPTTQTAQKHFSKVVLRLRVLPSLVSPREEHSPSLEPVKFSQGKGQQSFLS